MIIIPQIFEPNPNGLIKSKKLKIELFFFSYKWCDAGLFFYINDLLDESNEFFSFNRFKEIYGIETPFLQYMGILHMTPTIWKVRVKLTIKNHSNNL